MLLPIFILCLSHLVLATPVQPEYKVGDIEVLKYHFNDFKVKYNRSYAAEEEELRLGHFKENLVEIMELRKRNPFAEFDINKFADSSPQEKENLACFKGDNLDKSFPKCKTTHHGEHITVLTISASFIPINVTVPDTLDYRDKNVVSPVQDQGHCGSCWAFSATGAVEGAFALKHNYVVKLSEQQLVDCDPGSFGCAGGSMISAFRTMILQGGQQLEADYSYQEKEDDFCKFNQDKVRVHLIDCLVYLGIDDDILIQALLVQVGPLSIALDATPFRGYVKGIITDCDYDYLSHGVLLIGYGEENGIPYWLIKNSWGADWGDEGYVKIQRGVNCLGIGAHVTGVEVE